MLIVDASCLYELLSGGPRREAVAAVLFTDEDQAAPHVVDAEVLGLIRRDRLVGAIDTTAAGLAVRSLRDWPGERFGHQMLLERAWQLRANVRSWDALYVALAEALQGTLITLDGRLARADGPMCPVVVPGHDH